MKDELRKRVLKAYNGLKSVGVLSVPEEYCKEYNYKYVDVIKNICNFRLTDEEVTIKLEQLYIKLKTKSDEQIKQH